jgi:hypothetical protein
MTSCKMHGVQKFADVTRHFVSTKNPVLQGYDMNW